MLDKKPNPTESGTCAVCRKPTARIGNKGHKYRMTCSRKCFRALKLKTNETTQAKRRKTTLERYGVDSITKLESVKTKKVKTSIRHYGVEHPLQNKDVMNKLRQTNIRKYGFAECTRNEKVIAKLKRTNIERHGHTCPLQSTSIKRKARKTLMRNYGVEHNMRSAEVQTKRIDTLHHRYGVDHPMSKVYANAASKYGGIHPIQLGNHPIISVSKAEHEIADWLQHDLGLEIEQSNRTILKGKEIDILIPSAHMGIEYDGVYWHREKRNPDHNYMFNKWKDGLAAGIQIINVWDVEWKTRKAQIKNFLMSKLIRSHPVYARKCDVSSLTAAQASNFVNQNHIQPLSVPQIRKSYGLVYEDDVVGVVTFGAHPRCADKIALTRVCFKSGLRVTGGVSKLLSHALQENPNWGKIITWSDNRWSLGKMYAVTGFIKEEELQPDYAYWKAGTNGLVAKQSCTKKKLNASLHQTEYERAVELGMDRVWDCGKVRWTYTPNE